MDEIHATAIARMKTKEWNKDKKASVWIGGYYYVFTKSTETECKYCKIRLYLTHDNDDLIKEKYRVVCPACALKRYKRLNEEQKQVLEKIVERFQREN